MRTPRKPRPGSRAPRGVPGGWAVGLSPTELVLRAEAATFSAASGEGLSACPEEGSTGLSPGPAAGESRELQVREPRMPGKGGLRPQPGSAGASCGRVPVTSWGWSWVGEGAGKGGGREKTGTY